jgi:ribosomal-protein-alanine N-acetyltransferase
MREPRKSLCNVCGKEIKVENDIVKEDCLIVEKEWGYFSDKDLEVHHLCICEHCYDEWIKSFKIPVKIIEQENVFQIK